MVPAARTHFGERIKFIDGLRGLAVLAVVVCHAGGAFVPGSLPSRVLAEGAHGVDLFFVLSGFCLAYPYLARARADGRTTFDVREFFARRSVRIVPPYLFAIVFLFALERAAWPASFVPSWSDVVRQALFLDRDTPLVSGAFWTLAVEARWYLVFPFALALWFRAPRAVGALALVALTAYYGTFAGNLDALMLPGFLAGIAAAALAVRGDARRRPFAALVVVATLASVAIDAASPMTIFPLRAATLHGGFALSTTTWQIAAFASVALVTAMPGLQRAFAFRPLAWLGTISYSVYLTHEPIVISLCRAPLPIAAPLRVALCVVVAAAVGYGFWRLFERPFVEGALREPALARTRTWFASALAFLGIPERVALVSDGAAVKTSIASAAGAVVNQSGANGEKASTRYRGGARVVVEQPVTRIS
jgi:peptidoglycan/LPS O-acetylase OafA/YrhL